MAVAVWPSCESCEEWDVAHGMLIFLSLRREVNILDQWKLVKVIMGAGD